MTKQSVSGLKVARNALRPFFNRIKPLRRDQQFQTIRNVITQVDLPKLYSQVEENKAYFFDGLGNTYPSSTSNIPDVALARLTPHGLRREIIIQCERLNHHKVKLCEAVVSLDQITNLIAAEAWEDAERAIQAHQEQYGFSIALTKKDLLVAFQKGGMPGLSKRYQTLTKDADRRVWGLICKFTYNLVDPANHPVRNIKQLLGLLSERNSESRWYIAPLFWETLGFANSKETVADTLLRYNAISLMDMLLYVWRSAAVHEKQWSELKSIDGILDDELMTTLNKHLKRRHIPLVPRYKGADKKVSGADLYRLAFFFDEYVNVARWRAQTAAFLFADGIAAADRASATVGPLHDIVSEGQHHLTQLRPAQLELDAWLQAVVPDHASVAEKVFYSSIVVAELLRRLSTEKISPSTVVYILASFPDIQDHLESPAFLRLAKDPVLSRDHLLVFMLREYIFRRERSQDNDLERRAAFMTMFSQSGREAIVPLFVALAAECEPAARFLAKVCSRTFLERLYLLMGSVKDVIETRIEICEWLASRPESDKDDFEDELNALRRELINLDARSDLDSTRVHVDEEALREWFNDTQYSPAIRYARTVSAEGEEHRYESFVSFYRRLKEDSESEAEDGGLLFETQVGSQFVFLEIVEATLRAFVSDKSFGMDAYLSRRIRHGTLSGFLLTPLARVTQRIKDAASRGEQLERDDFSVVQSTFDGWRTALSMDLDRVRRELIQIRSEAHPDGLIDASWRSGAGVTYLDAMLSRIRPRFLDGASHYDMFPDIYSLCWELVERDLARVRLYLYSEFYRIHGERLGAVYDALSHSQKRIAHPFFLEAQTSLQARVQEICGWFIRPVVRRDKYDLATLISSTISIIRELDVGYDFKEKVAVQEGLTINRGAFEVLGDVLFVLLGNAAKHGARGGEVEVIAQEALYSVPSVVLDIISHTETIEAHSTAISRIERAFRIDDDAALELAAVGEGFSGIRKLVGLLNRVKADDCRWGVSHDPGALKITFKVVIPLEITFRRERT